MQRVFWLGFLTLGIVVWGACSDSSDTSPTGGSAGATNDGGGGSGNTGGDGGNTGGTGGDGGDAAGGSGGGACIPFAGPCSNGDVCCDAAGATGTCFAFGMGSKCTIPCPTDPADCPNNGAGCNNQSPQVCKAQ